MKGRSDPEQKPIKEVVVADGEQLQDAIYHAKCAWNQYSIEPLKRKAHPRENQKLGDCSPSFRLIIHVH